MKQLDSKDRDRWLMQLRQWTQAGHEGREAYRHPMTVNELRRMAQSTWVTIGAHTTTNTPLSSLPVAAQREEIAGSKRQMESWLGREITVFSYPFGCKGDYTRESVKLCREAGFVKAAANFPGQAHRWTDPYQIPRQLIRNWQRETFGQKLKSFWVL